MISWKIFPCVTGLYEIKWKTAPDFFEERNKKILTSFSRKLFHFFSFHKDLNSLGYKQLFAIGIVNFKEDRSSFHFVATHIPYLKKKIHYRLQVELNQS